MWYVYILRCVDDTLYTGITTDVEKRVLTHNTAKTGAKYTKMRRPVELVYQEPQPDRSSAAKREWEVKQLSRPDKLILIAQR